jgi:hypothetical protein
MRGIKGMYWVLASAALAVGCSSSPTGPKDDDDERIVGPQEPTLHLFVAPSVATLRGGGRLALSASAASADRLTVRAVSVTWTSSDDAVATVTSDGVVTGGLPGLAKITARSGLSTAVARITVLKAGPPEVACLSVIPKTGDCQ